MHVSAHLDIDLLAHNADEDVTCLVNLQAPTPPQVANRPGQTLVVVLDRSGSMQGEPLSGAKDAIRHLAHRLAPQDAFGLVVFDDTAEVIVPVRTMAQHDLTALLAAVDAVPAGNMTDISAGYLLGIREAKRSLASSGHRGATVLLISDGEANHGMTKQEEFEALAGSAYQDTAITTCTLGLGRHYNELLLAALTKGGNGEHRFAPTIAEAAAEISALVGLLLEKSVVAAQLRIKRQPALVSQVLLRNDMPAFIDGDAVVVSLGDFYAAEERSLLVKFRVPGLPNLGTTTIADIVLEFTTLPDLKEHTVTLPIAINVVPGDEARGRIPNPVVEVASLLADISDEKKQAADALRQGDSARARTTLSGSISKVSTKRQHLQAQPDAEPSLTQLLDEAARELLQLADDVIHRDVAYSSKAMTQAWSSSSRGRRNRPQAKPDPDDSE